MKKNLGYETNLNTNRKFTISAFNVIFKPSCPFEGYYEVEMIILHIIFIQKTPTWIKSGNVICWQYCVAVGLFLSIKFLSVFNSMAIKGMPNTAIVTAEC